MSWITVAITWYENPWLIACASIILTYLATPLLDGIFGWLRSRKGALTGTYLALTNQRGTLVVELARCWQVGSNVRGRIDGVLAARPTDGRINDYERTTKARYKFSGKRIGDVVALSYWDSSRSRSVGTISLRALPPDDQILMGGWVGAVGVSMSRAKCTWIRVDRSDFPLDDIDAFVLSVNCALEVADSTFPLLGYVDNQDWSKSVHKSSEPDYRRAIGERIAKIRQGWRKTK